MEASVHYCFLFTIFFFFFITFMVCSCSGSSSFQSGADQHYVHHGEFHGSHETGNPELTSRSGGGYVVNVDDFGAKADRKTDDSQAFLKAWKNACSVSRSVLLVPANKVYYLKPIIFQGPCNPGITLRIQGSIIASKNRTDYAQNQRVWIKFSNLTRFNIDGGGVLYGNGQIWWPLNCNVNRSRPCNAAPTALTFERCTNLKVSHLQINNGQQQHISLNGCGNVEASYIKIRTNATSPNTDGIHITKSSNIQISSCDFETGDDCIDIVAGSKDIRVTDFKCGQGAHGISIGSLGRNGSEEFVSNITVTRATITGTLNGVRIKTWQGGRGSANNIIFENIEMHNVTNPIIINQFYCGEYFENLQECPVQKNAVLVKNVLYKNITGTSALEMGIIFNCSATVPCQGIKLDNVRLKNEENGTILASCSNANVEQVGTNTPQCQN